MDSSAGTPNFEEGEGSGAGETRAAEEAGSEDRSRCPSLRPLDGQSVLSVVLGIQRRSAEQQAPSSSRPSLDILTRVLGNSQPQPEASICDRATATSSPLVSSLEVNLSDTVLARSITLENIQSRAEARIELVNSTVFSQSPPSYSTIPPEESTYFHVPPPPSYEQTFGIRYLDRDLPFIAVNNSANNIWGYRSQPAYCVRCNAMVLTNIEASFCYVTHLTALLSFLVLCWPCMAVPYIFPVFKEVHHYCPACNQFLGCYRPISRRRTNDVLARPR